MPRIWLCILLLLLPVAVSAQGAAEDDRGFITRMIEDNLSAAGRDVRIRGFIANVWTPYDFWTNGRLSHCGIDSFELIKTEQGWRIAGGTYTIENKCEPSPLGPLKK